MTLSKTNCQIRVKGKVNILWYCKIPTPHLSIRFWLQTRHFIIPLTKRDFRLELPGKNVQDLDRIWRSRIVLIELDLDEMLLIVVNVETQNFSRKDRLNDFAQQFRAKFVHSGKTKRISICYSSVKPSDFWLLRIWEFLFVLNQYWNDFPFSKA